ncbi:retrovirus-related pol polyprotein from transposon TNT 1-94 [Tanacetum coccineum]
MMLETHRELFKLRLQELTATNVQCYNCSEKGHYARNCPKPRVRDSKYFMEQMLLAKQDEVGVILTDEENDFLFADASRMEEIEELSANICLMVRIQLANFDSDEGPNYDYSFLREVQTPSTSYVNPLFAKDKQEQKYPKQPKIINNKIGDDQIDSNIIFDEPNEDVNSGSVEYDNYVQESHELEKLARNAFKEAEKQQIIVKKVQQQNTMLTKQLESYKEKVRVFEMTKGNNTTYFNEYIEADRKAIRFEKESQSQFIHDRDIIRDSEQQRDKLELSVVELKRQTVELQKTQSILKRKMSENKDKYHDVVLDLEARPKKNEDVVLKIGNSLQGMFMLGPKHNLKLYDVSCLDDLKIHVNVRDTEDILDDATKSQIKIKNKSQDPIAIKKKQNFWTIDYKKLNALYEDFVPQKEFSAEQKYFSSSLISSENSSNASSPSSSSETKPTVAPMTNEIEKLQWESIEIQEGIQKRINILENDVQRCQKQSLDFELQLQHEKERQKCESSLKKVCETSWISKMEKLERLCAASSIRRSLNRDSPLKNSVLSNTKKSSKKVEVFIRTNKKTYVASKNIVSNKKIVTNVDVQNDLTAKDVLCVSCAKNLLIPCHDKGDDLLTRAHESNLYTISISDMASSLPVCLISKATSTKSWLWHRRLSHQNIGTINDLTKNDLVDGLPKFKYSKDHLCSACERGKSKKYSHPPKLVYFLHTKDEIPEIIKKFIAQVQHYAIILTARTPQQNGVVERRNRTLVEAIRTMLIFSRLLEFLCAEEISTDCFTQNWSIIHTRYNKTPYELLHDSKPNVEYFHVFGLLCYLKNDREDLGKMKPKADIGIFIGYSKTCRDNRLTKKIMETIHVKFDKLTSMASEHDSLEAVSQ